MLVSYGNLVGQTIINLIWLALLYCSCKISIPIHSYHCQQFKIPSEPKIIMVQQQITTSWLLESVGYLNFRLDIQSTSLNIDQTIPFLGLSVSQIKLLLLNSDWKWIWQKCLQIFLMKSSETNFIFLPAF